MNFTTDIQVPERMNSKDLTQMFTYAVNISTSTCISTFGADIHGTETMHPADCSDPLTFRLAPL